MHISGTVITGDQYGRQLGFPTANISADDYVARELSVTPGIYAGWVTVGESNEPHRAGIVISPGETSAVPKIEAHLLDFNGDLYGQEVTFYPIEFLRDYQHFESEVLLIAAIADDISNIKKMELCSLESLK